MTQLPTAVRSRDLAEIALGSAVLAFPVATAQEIWDLSKELSTFRIVAIGLSSLIVLAVFVFVVYRREDGAPVGRAFWHRVTAVYGVTLLVCAAILWMIDRLPLLTDPSVAIHRTIMVAFPASFSATVVDSLN